MADLQFTTETSTASPAGTYGMSGAMDGGAAAQSVGSATSPIRPASGPPKMQMFSDSAHPMACLFHIAFKAGALFLYIFGGWFSKDSKVDGSVSGANFITVTVLCILLMAADFWTVKNVTGRLLVGLRWWCQVEPDGTNKWLFESAETTNVNKFDNFIFWSVLYGTPALWSALFLLGVIKFNLGWLITVCLAIALSGANLYGFYKCSSSQKAKFQALVDQGTSMGAVYLLKSGVLNLMGKGAMAQAQANANAAQAPASSFV